jgi:hypothetical protein
MFFGKIVDPKGANWGSAWRYPWWGQFYSFSWLGLARGSALAGHTTKARKAFQDFVELWNAEDDIPILQQAKRKDAKLQWETNDEHRERSTAIRTLGRVRAFCRRARLSGQS